MYFNSILKTQPSYKGSKHMKNKALIIIISLIVIVSSEFKAAPYAEWAHSHVVWLNGRQQNQQQMYKLLNTYLSYDIPVGGVNIDSAWSNCINNFDFNRTKFPNPEQLVKDFHSKGAKVILWATSIVNQECPEFEEGKKNGYFLNGGKLVKWWHGNGAFVDFFNPAAKKWFTSLMDRVINMGFDGWKCDGADPIILLLRPWPYSATKKRYITYPEYAHQYYGTFYNYTKSKNPDTLIMSRPVDSAKNIFFLSYSPKYVMFSGWVGDQHNTPQGFRQAMVNVIHSATKNYLNFGFDIGGYKESGPTAKFLLLRWMQTGALLPFMENGGNGKHQPWLYDQQTIDIYRQFVKIHYDLKQFFLTSGTDAYSKHKSVVQPLILDGKTFQLVNPSNLGYVLWNTFLVEPIFEQSGFVQVIFPAGYKWIYYFNHSKIYNGGNKLAMGIRLNETALFIRSNTIFPLKQQLWIVYPQKGSYSTSIIAGDHSDDVTVEYLDSYLKIRVQRFYRNQEVKKSRSETFIKVRLIGVQQQPVTMIVGEGKSLPLQLTLTEYTNQFYIDVPLNEKVLISPINFNDDIQFQK